MTPRDQRRRVLRREDIPLREPVPRAPEASPARLLKLPLLLIQQLLELGPWLELLAQVLVRLEEVDRVREEQVEHLLELLWRHLLPGLRPEEELLHQHRHLLQLLQDLENLSSFLIGEEPGQGFVGTRCHVRRCYYS